MKKRNISGLIKLGLLLGFLGTVSCIMPADVIRQTYLLEGSSSTPLNATLTIVFTSEKTVNIAGQEARYDLIGLGGLFTLPGGIILPFQISSDKKTLTFVGKKYIRLG